MVGPLSAEPVRHAPLPVEAGSLHPLGATPSRFGVNFSLASTNATGVELLSDGAPQEPAPRTITTSAPCGCRRRIVASFARGGTPASWTQVSLKARPTTYIGSTPARAAQLLSRRMLHLVIDARVAVRAVLPNQPLACIPPAQCSPSETLTAMEAGCAGHVGPKSEAHYCKRYDQQRRIPVRHQTPFESYQADGGSSESEKKYPETTVYELSCRRHVRRLFCHLKAPAAHRNSPHNVDKRLCLPDSSTRGRHNLRIQLPAWCPPPRLEF